MVSKFDILFTFKIKGKYKNSVCKSLMGILKYILYLIKTMYCLNFKTLLLRFINNILILGYYILV